MKSLLIVNARLVNEGREFEADLYVHNGRIEAIGPDLAHRRADRVIDAAGLHLLPGMIDDQVHFREPGLTHKADIASESRAAVAGGITSFMEMPNTRPPATDLEALEAKYAIAERGSVANFSFYLGATNDNLAAIRAIDPAAHCGIKVFMGASTGNMLVDDTDTLHGIFEHAPTLIATHCEDTPTIEDNERRFRARYGEAVPMACHPLIRSHEACYKSSRLAVELAREHDARLHVLHLTTERELDLFEARPVGDKRITVEACVHHLLLDDRDYEDKGTLVKCNPAIKTRCDRDALRQALAQDKLDVIGTDHAPHTLEEKNQSYFKAPAGLPLVQHALPAALELHHDGVLSLADVVRKTSHDVARCFRLRERGFLREGYWADLVLVDLHTPFTVRREDLLYKCGWSPFEGRVFRSTVRTTIVSGRLAWHEGGIVEGARGLRLAFSRQRR
jgi:dihydroorotase